MNTDCSHLKLQSLEDESAVLWVLWIPVFQAVDVITKLYTIMYIWFINLQNILMDSAYAMTSTAVYGHFTWLLHEFDNLMENSHLMLDDTLVSCTSICFTTVTSPPLSSCHEKYCFLHILEQECILAIASIHAVATCITKHHSLVLVSNIKQKPFQAW